MEQLPREIQKKRLTQRCSDASEMIQVSGQDFHLEQILKEFVHFLSTWERLNKHFILAYARQNPFR